ncbi:hypothetical protein N5I78_29355, partial [Klebsiella quasipneumoniae]
MDIGILLNLFCDHFQVASQTTPLSRWASVTKHNHDFAIFLAAREMLKQGQYAFSVDIFSQYHRTCESAKVAYRLFAGYR